MGPVWVIRKKKQRVKSFRILDGVRGKAPGKSGGTSLAQLEELYRSIERQQKIQCRIFKHTGVLLTDPEYLETAKIISAGKKSMQSMRYGEARSFQEVFSKWRMYT